MKGITQDYYEEKTVDNTVDSLHRIILAVVVTGLLYFFHFGWRLPQQNAAVPELDESTVELSDFAVKRVLQDVSVRSGLPTSDLRIVEAETEVIDIECLRIAESTCTPGLEPALQVTVASQQQRWIYRFDRSGSKFELARVSPSAN